MTKQLGMIALGLALTLGMLTASWAQGGAAKQKTNGAAPAQGYVPPNSNEPERCFAPSPWGYQWVCG